MCCRGRGKASAPQQPPCPCGAATPAQEIKIALMGYRHRREAGGICNLITKNQSKIENIAIICYFVTK